MKDQIKKLKTLADNIQAAKLGQRGKEIHINSYTVIDEYHKWRTETVDLFEQYFDTSNTLYVNFISLPSDGNGFVLMEYFDQQYPIFKVLINKIESGEILESKKKITNPTTTVQEKTIFISHASKDKEIIEAFVDLILTGALSVHIDQIFCVSTDGTKIKSGADWRNSIKESLLSTKINFLIITPNYKESEVCLNEMGAAWVTSATVLPLIVEPINYKTVGIIQEPKQIEKLLDENSLDRIKDIVQEKLDIPSSRIKSDRWTAKKRDFLSRIDHHLISNPFQMPMDRNTFEKLQTENTDLKKTVENLIEEKTNLEKLIRDLEYTKDKDEVKKIIAKHKHDSDFEEFVEVAEKATRQFAKFSPIIIGIIFKEYSGKEIKINWSDYREDIDYALAEDFITEELRVDWETTPEMQNINESLNELSSILERNLTKAFEESFRNKYGAPQKIDNKTFWENVFGVAISF